MNVNLANSSFCFWVWPHATFFMLKGIEYFRRIFIAQDHTLQDHFCSMIDEFPVWSSETDQAAMMWIVPYSEREGATEHNNMLCRWSPDLDKEPSERCNITSPCLPWQLNRGVETTWKSSLFIVCWKTLPHCLNDQASSAWIHFLRGVYRACCPTTASFLIGQWGPLKLIDTRKTN